MPVEPPIPQQEPLVPQPGQPTAPPAETPPMPGPTPDPTPTPTELPPPGPDIDVPSPGGPSIAPGQPIA